MRPPSSDHIRHRHDAREGREVHTSNFKRALTTRPESPLKLLFAPLEKCVGRRLKLSPYSFGWWRYNMPCPPTFFSLGFVFGEVSKIKVTFVTFV